MSVCLEQLTHQGRRERQERNFSCPRALSDRGSVAYTKMLCPLKCVRDWWEIKRLSSR